MTVEHQEILPEFNFDAYIPIEYKRTGSNTELRVTLSEELDKDEEIDLNGSLFRLLDESRLIDRLEGIWIRELLDITEKTIPEFVFIFERLILDDDLTENGLKRVNVLNEQFRNSLIGDLQWPIIFSIAQSGGDFDSYLARKKEIETKGKSTKFLGEVFSSMTVAVVKFVD